jgi:YVTN family beta-propeller protein
VWVVIAVAFSLLPISSCGGCIGSCIGSGPPPSGAKVSPSSLTFAAQAIGTISAAKTVTLSNQGTGALSISSILTSGDFQQTNNCGNQVVAAQSCLISVTFLPTVTGTRTGTLTITESAPSAKQTVSLSGTATLAASQRTAACEVSGDTPDSCQSSFAGALRRLYVTRLASNSVSVIDPVDWHLVASVPVGKNPAGIALLPNGRELYVSNFGGDTVSVVDTRNEVVVATVPVGMNPSGIAVDADGSSVWVANFGSNTVSRIDVHSKTVRDTIPVGSHPRGIGVSPNGDRVYVANASEQTLSEISTEANRVVATIHVGQTPMSVAVAPAGDFVYVSNAGSASVSVIALAQHSVIATVPVGTNPVAVVISSDGNRAFVVNQNLLKGPGSVTVVDAKGLKPVATLAVGNNPLGIGISEEDDTIYVSNYLDSTVSMLDLHQALIKSTHAVGLLPVAVAVWREPPAGLAPESDGRP